MRDTNYPSEKLEGMVVDSSEKPFGPLKAVEVIHQEPLYAREIMEVTATVQVVIPTFNSYKTLEMCLNSVLNQSCKDWKLMIVDNNSTDDTLKIADEFGLCMKLVGNKVEIVKGKFNRSQAYNYALKHSGCPYFAFVDSDCVLPTHWLEMLLLEIEKDEEIGAVGGFYKTAEEAGLWARIVGFELDTRCKRMKRGGIPRLPTGGLLIKREVLEKVPFDSNLKTAEETDWGYRLANCGYKIVFVPEAYVWHHHRNSIWKYFKQQFEYGYRVPDFYIQNRKAIRGDPITSFWMNVQPLIFGLGIVFFPVLLGLLLYWCILSLRNLFKTRNLSSLGLVFVYMIRTCAWFLGLVGWAGKKLFSLLDVLHLKVKQIEVSVRALKLEARAEAE